MSKHTRGPRNPYGNTAKRKAALAYLAARGITQPRALYPVPAIAVPHPDRAAIALVAFGKRVAIK
jgi:hypothetical protein